MQQLQLFKLLLPASLWALGGLFASLGAFALFFTFFLVRTPWKLENEMIVGNEKASADLKMELAQLSSELDDVRIPSKIKDVQNFLREHERLQQMALQTQGPGAPLSVTIRLRTEFRQFLKALEDFAALQYVGDLSAVAFLGTDFDNKVQTTDAVSLVFNFLTRVKMLLDLWLRTSVPAATAPPAAP